MDFRLTNKNVLITGGSHGIGFEIAKAFATEGSNLTLVSRNENRLSEALSELPTKKNRHDFICANLLEKKQLEIFTQKLIKNKEYDVIVHCVGGGLGVRGAFPEIKDLEKVWWFNVGSAIALNNYFIPILVERGWGRIVHISSISAVVGEPPGGSLAYSSSKAYLNAYIQGVSREVASRNVIVSGILPGPIQSPGKYWDNLLKESPNEVVEFLKNHQSIGRLGKPSEISCFAVFLGSELASFASGSLVQLTGGRY